MSPSQRRLAIGWAAGLLAVACSTAALAAGNDESRLLGSERPRPGHLFSAQWRK